MELTRRFGSCVQLFCVWGENVEKRFIFATFVTVVVDSSQQTDFHAVGTRVSDARKGVSARDRFVADARPDCICPSAGLAWCAHWNHATSLNSFSVITTSRRMSHDHQLFLVLNAIAVVAFMNPGLSACWSTRIY